MADQTQAVAFRLYGQVGCPHCAQAEQFLRVRNLPAQLIPLFNDPILASGIRSITGGDALPILVSFISEKIEIVVGYKENEYKRLAELFFDTVSRTSAQAAQVIAEPIPALEEAVSAQPMSDDVGSSAALATA